MADSVLAGLHGNRQFNGESCAVAGDAGHLMMCPIVLLDQVRTMDSPSPAPSCPAESGSSAGCGFVHPVETVEDSRSSGEFPGVGDGNPATVASLPSRQLIVPPAGELDGVIDEVDQRCFDLIGPDRPSAGRPVRRRAAKAGAFGAHSQVVANQ